MHKMKHEKIRPFGVPNLYIIGPGLLTIVLLAFFMNGYDHYRKKNAGYSYDELKTRNIVISEQEIYDFMNYTLFGADSLIDDKRESMKLICFSLKHKPDIKRFIFSQPDTVLTTQDRKYMGSQCDSRIFLWDQNKLINVWCLTPKDLYEFNENDTTDYWEHFEKLFGNHGYHRYSKPILNQEKNIAVIAHSGREGWLGGIEEILLFKKENGKWKLVKELILLMI